jgi:hypothetical protein
VYELLEVELDFVARFGEGEHVARIGDRSTLFIVEQACKNEEGIYYVCLEVGGSNEWSIWETDLYRVSTPLSA